MSRWDLLTWLTSASCNRIDPNLLEWPENDFRIFVGDLGNETNDEVLNKAFARFPTFNKAKVVRDKKTNKTKGMLASKSYINISKEVLHDAFCLHIWKQPWVLSILAKIEGGVYFDLNNNPIVSSLQSQSEGEDRFI